MDTVTEMSKIEIVIHNDGCVDLELSEFNDTSCLDATRTIEYLLGEEILNRRIYSNRLSETIPHTNQSEAIDVATVKT